MNLGYTYKIGRRCRCLKCIWFTHYSSKDFMRKIRSDTPRCNTPRNLWWSGIPLHWSPRNQTRVNVNRTSKLVDSSQSVICLKLLRPAGHGSSRAADWPSSSLGNKQSLSAKPLAWPIKDSAFGMNLFLSSHVSQVPIEEQSMWIQWWPNCQDLCLGWFNKMVRQFGFSGTPTKTARLYLWYIGILFTNSCQGWL